MAANLLGTVWDSLDTPDMMNLTWKLGLAFTEIQNGE